MVAVAAIAAIFLGRYLLRTTQTVTGQTTGQTQVVRANLKPAGMNTASSIAKKEYEIAGDGSTPIPAKFQLPGVARVRTAANFKEWIAQFPASEQEKIVAFNKRNFQVYNVNSVKQVAWMALYGYPMPEDIIAAQKFSNTDLREMAKSGNEKAGYLLRERNIEETAEKLSAFHAKEGTAGQNFWEQDPDGPRLAQENSADQHFLLNAWGSPFVGYLRAREEALIDDDPVFAQAKVIGGLLLANSLGDSRAESFADDYYVGIDPTRMAILYGATSVSSGPPPPWLRNCGYSDIAPIP